MGVLDERLTKSCPETNCGRLLNEVGSVPKYGLTDPLGNILAKRSPALLPFIFSIKYSVWLQKAELERFTFAPQSGVGHNQKS